MFASASQPEDLLSQRIDDLLRGGLAAAPDTADELPPEMEELLAVAGLLAETLGGGTPNSDARAAGFQRLLTSARQPRARILLFPAVAHRDSVAVGAAGRGPRREG